MARRGLLSRSMQGIPTFRRAVVTIALAASSAGASADAAERWGAPIQLPHPGSFGHRVAVDAHGNVRFPDWQDGPGVITLERGATRTRRCSGPRWTGPAPIQGNLAFNNAGAMVDGWTYGPTGGAARFAVATAPAGRCFGAIRTVSPPDVNVQGVDLFALGPQGTAVASWREPTSAGVQIAFASGRAGHHLVRRGILLRADGVHRFYGFAPGFAGRERLVWSWLESGPDGVNSRNTLEQLWSRVGGLRAASPGSPARTSRIFRGDPDHDNSLEFAQVLTMRSGRQVLAWLGDGKFRVMTRGPGKRFGSLRTFSAPDAQVRSLRTAANSRGDSVFCWGDLRDVYALTRRSDGHLVGPRLLSPGAHPAIADHPSAAVAGSGRAIVAWIAHDGNESLGPPGDVRVATARRGGAFGGRRVVSGQPLQFDGYPVEVSAGSHGDVAVVWTRRTFGAYGNESDRAMISRSRLRH